MSAAQEDISTWPGAEAAKPRAIERVPLLQQNSAAAGARLALMEKTNTQGVGNVAAEYRSLTTMKAAMMTTTSEATTTTGRDMNMTAIGRQRTTTKTKPEYGQHQGGGRRR